MTRVGDDADRTQVIPRQSIGGQAPSGPGSWAPRAHWSNADDYSAPGPPWGGSDAETIVLPRDPWVRRGPTAFDEGTSGKGPILGIIVIMVLVFVLATAGTVYSLNDGSNTAQSSPTPLSTAGPTATQTTTVALPEPPPEKSPPAASKNALIDPPGKARAGGGSFDLAALRTNHLLSAPMVDALTTAGMKDGLLKTTTDDGVTVGLYALTVRSQSAAANVAQVYGTIQRDGGLRGNQQLSMVGVPVFSAATDARDPVYRTVYVLYDRAIILEAFESPHARQVFAELLQQQVNLAPPTVRVF